MPRTLQTGHTQAICIERHDSFIDRCIEVIDAALKRQAAAPVLHGTRANRGTVA